MALLATTARGADTPPATTIINPAIDAGAYLRTAFEAMRVREERRLSEADFYCNNNFRNAERPFPSKLPSASLNLSTWVALFNYGYRNVWELAPLIDVEATALVFDSSPQTPR